MPWFAWLSIIVVCMVATAVIMWLLGRSRSSAAKALVEVEKAKAEVAIKRADIERATHEQLKLIRDELARKLIVINTWYAGAKAQITREKQDEYEILAGDPTALDSKLDKLLGTDETSDNSSKDE